MSSGATIPLSPTKTEVTWMYQLAHSLSLYGTTVPRYKLQCSIEPSPSPSELPRFCSKGQHPIVPGDGECTSEFVLVFCTDCFPREATPCEYRHPTTREKFGGSGEGGVQPWGRQGPTYIPQNDQGFSLIILRFSCWDKLFERNFVSLEAAMISFNCSNSKGWGAKQPKWVWGESAGSNFFHVFHTPFSTSPKHSLYDPS